jgi:hypothetical protein
MDENDKNLLRMRISIVGLFTFKALGGRFWSIAPSSYLNLGSFARKRFSLPAIPRAFDSKTTMESRRNSLDRMFRVVGCHSCGKRYGPFVADHQPPKAVARELNQKWGGIREVPVRYYPQCKPCSDLKGRRDGGSKRRSSFLCPQAHVHFRSRLSYLTGGVLAGVAVLGINYPSELSSHRRYRYERWLDE